MLPIPEHDPGSSSFSNQRKEDPMGIKESSPEVYERDENCEREDSTHHLRNPRITFCHPAIRKVMVTNPIFTCFKLLFVWVNLFWLVTVVGLIFTSWTVLYFLFGDTMLPYGSSFGFFLLVIFSYSLGWALAYIPYVNLPPIFGMLLAGIILRNTEFYNIYEELGISTTSKIRTFCLTFIMIRAGIQLTTTALRQRPLFILILALFPCSIEMLVLSVCCRYILGYPWDWAFMTGTIIACMSPIVTINCMLALAEQGYGEDKGLATLLCCAASIDDVHIVSLFSICYSIVFTNDENITEWWSYIPPGLRDFLLSLVAGGIFGFFLVFFPHRNHKHATWYRVSMLILGGLMCTTAASKLTITGGGYLAAVVMSFVATKGWQVLTKSYNMTPLRRTVYFLWHFTQPVLIGVIGADIDFQDWSTSRFVLYVVCIFIGLAARSICTFLTTIRTSFSWKERLFVIISWLPKGTLQAALAPLAWEYANKEENLTKIGLAVDVVRISVVAIVILAPFGAIAMMSTGPFLLNKISIEEHQRERELSYLRIINLQPIKIGKETKSTIIDNRRRSVLE